MATKRRPLFLLLVYLHLSCCNSWLSVKNVGSRRYAAPIASTSSLSLSKHRVVQRAHNPNESNTQKETAKLPLPKTKLSRKEEYAYRKQLWLDRYGSLSALQNTFGNTKGDLTPEQTRRLYHTLLPRSLLGLHEMGLMKPEELAPLAYEARMAAKQYARQRCVWYARVATQLFDQYRNLRDRGKLKIGTSTGMTWDEIWSKYEAQIVQEECTKELDKQVCIKEKDLTLRIYLRILEKSTATNPGVDSMFLNTDGDDLALDEMAQQLDQDVKEILLRPKDSEKAVKKEAKLEKKQLKEQLKEQEKEAKRLEKEQKWKQKLAKERAKLKAKREKEMAKRREEAPEEEEETLEETEEEDTSSLVDDRKTPKTAEQKRFEVLRILAGTRQKFRRILKL